MAGVFNDFSVTLFSVFGVITIKLILYRGSNSPRAVVQRHVLIHNPVSESDSTLAIYTRTFYRLVKLSIRFLRSLTECVMLFSMRYLQEIVDNLNTTHIREMP